MFSPFKYYLSISFRMIKNKLDQILQTTQSNCGQVDYKTLDKVMVNFGQDLSFITKAFGDNLEQCSDLCQPGNVRCSCFCWSVTGITFYIKVKISPTIYLWQFKAVSFFRVEQFTLSSKLYNNWCVLVLLFFNQYTSYPCNLDYFTIDINLIAAIFFWRIYI